jgi:hypothetical protein
VPVRSVRVFIRTTPLDQRYSLADARMVWLSIALHVLADFDPDFSRQDFVSIITQSAWPE